MAVELGSYGHVWHLSSLFCPLITLYEISMIMVYIVHCTMYTFTMYIAHASTDVPCQYKCYTIIKDVVTRQNSQTSSLYDWFNKKVNQ